MDYIRPQLMADIYNKPVRRLTGEQRIMLNRIDRPQLLQDAYDSMMPQKPSSPMG